MKKMTRVCLAACLALFAGLAFAVQPIQGNSGQYLSPYTSDGVTADWVDKSINAKMGSAVGGAVGAYAGAKAMENVPFIGGFLGNKVGKAAGRKAALAASGGEDYMRQTSDLSFNSLEEMSVWMYRNHGQSANYAEVLKATQEVYPEMKQVYPVAVARAANGGAATAASGSAAPAQYAAAPATPAAPPAPPKPYMERTGHATLALAKNSGDISGTGLAFDLGVINADTNALGVFFDLGFQFSSGDDVDFSEFVLALGPSWGFTDTVRGYVGLQLDTITLDTTNDTIDLFGVGYRLGAQFRMPAQKLILDVGVRSVDAEDDSYYGQEVTLDYTEPKVSLEYAISDGAGLLLGYEGRDDDSSMYFGIRGRF